MRVTYQSSTVQIIDDTDKAAASPSQTPLDSRSGQSVFAVRSFHQSTSKEASLGKHECIIINMLNELESQYVKEYAKDIVVLCNIKEQAQKKHIPCSK